MRPLDRINKILPYIPGKPIEELKRELGLSNIIKLASNENPLGPSPKAIAAAKKSLNHVNRYPEGDAHDLRRKLSKVWGLNPSQFVFGNGSNEILIFAAQAFCDAGENIAFSVNSFAVYLIAAQMVGATFCMTGGDSVSELEHDIESLSSAAQGSKVIYICNPNNPTGSWLSPDKVELLMKNVPRKTLIVLDEAYAEYAGQTYAQDKKWLAKFPNLLICRTFSKIYGLAGLRVGYGVASEEICNALEKCRQPFNLNLVAQKAAIAALDDKAFVRRSLKNNSEGMKLITEFFKLHQIYFVPSKTNFVFFRPPVEGLYEFLLKKGIILRPISINPKLPPFLRVTIGTKAENARFLKALKERLR